MQADERNAWQTIQDLVQAHGPTAFSKPEYEQALRELLKVLAADRWRRYVEEREKVRAQLPAPRPEYAEEYVVPEPEIRAIVEASQWYAKELAALLERGPIDEAYRRRVLRWIWEKEPRTKPSV